MNNPKRKENRWADFDKKMQQQLHEILVIFVKGNSGVLDLSSLYLPELPIDFFRIYRTPFSLVLCGNEIRDLNFLDNLKHDRMLKHGIVESKLGKILKLDLSANPLIDIDQIKLFSNLRHLNLSQCRTLKTLDVSQNPKLEYLNISDTGISEIKGLSNLKTLKTLIAEGSMLKSVEPFLEIDNLITLNISKTKIKKVKPLFKHLFNQYTEFHARGLDDTDISPFILDQGLEAIKREYSLSYWIFMDDEER